MVGRRPLAALHLRTAITAINWTDVKAKHFLQALRVSLRGSTQPRTSLTPPKTSDAKKIGSCPWRKRNRCAHYRRQATSSVSVPYELTVNVRFAATSRIRAGRAYFPMRPRTPLTGRLRVPDNYKHTHTTYATRTFLQQLHPTTYDTV